jgi:hypothetical protein
LEGKILQILHDPSELDLMMPFYQEIVEITAYIESIINNENGCVRKWLQRELGVEIKTQKQYGKIYLQAQSLDEDVIAVFKSRIENIVLSPGSFQSEIQQIREKKVHIFVDVSNIMIGSKKDQKTGEQDFSVRLDCKNLLELVSGMRQPIRTVVVGSTPSKDSVVWDRWRAAGWTDVRILERIVNDQGKSVEQAVDEVLHAAMSSDLLCSYPKPRTLVLLTGDGNANGGHTTDFPGVVQKALMTGWMVELWSWDTSTAYVYKKFKSAYPDNFFLRGLDQYHNYITFKMDPAVTKRPAPSPTSLDSLNTNKSSSNDDFEVIASPEIAARRLHDFIKLSSESHCISAFG